MRLYATVASERAEKSQGGNKTLNVDISINTREPRYAVRCNRDAETGQTTIEFLAKEFGVWRVKYETTELENVEEKGERRKGECVHCQALQRVTPGMKCFRH